MVPLLKCAATAAILQHFTSDSVQALACVKYLSTLAVSVADFVLAASPQTGADIPAKACRSARHPRQRQLILVIGCIDVTAYAAFCTGFAYCDGALATLVLAAGGQIFTAIMSKYILKKPLSKGQVVGVSFWSAPQSVCRNSLSSVKVAIQQFVLSNHGSSLVRLCAPNTAC